MKNIIELQRKTAQLTDDIKDVLHAAHINMQAIIVETSQLHQSLPSEFAYLHSLLQSLQKLIEERSQLHMGYLITRQIQEEQERVRRERLSDYEDKIYDQRRIISDKEGFFESLLRPKKKRLPNQTADQFQQARARQRENQERQKIEILIKEFSDIQALKRFIEIQERDSCFKQKTQQKQKNCSLSIVNSTSLSVNENCQFATEQIIPITDIKLNKEASPPTHNRTSSLQHSMVKETLAEQNIKQDGNIGALLNQIYGLKIENEQLHQIYEQQCIALKFKKGQCLKIQKEYESVSKGVVDARTKLDKVREQEKWRYERCSRPIAVVRRSNSGQK